MKPLFWERRVCLKRGGKQQDKRINTTQKIEKYGNNGPALSFFFKTSPPSTPLRKPTRLHSRICLPHVSCPHVYINPHTQHGRPPLHNPHVFFQPAPCFLPPQQNATGIDQAEEYLPTQNAASCCCCPSTATQTRHADQEETPTASRRRWC